jgi:hypothetical protein
MTASPKLSDTQRKNSVMPAVKSGLLRRDIIEELIPVAILVSQVGVQCFRCADTGQDICIARVICHGLVEIPAISGTTEIAVSAYEAILPLRNVLAHGTRATLRRDLKMQSEKASLGGPLSIRCL